VLASDGGGGTVFERAKPLFLALFLAMAVLGLVLVLLRLHHVLILLFISLVVAATLSAPSEFLARRGLPRGVAVMLVYLVFFGVLVVLYWIVVPPLYKQIAEFRDSVPSYVNRYEGLEKTYEDLRSRYPEIAGFDQQIDALIAQFFKTFETHLRELPSRALSTIINFLAVFFISIILVTQRFKMLDFLLTLVSPRRRDQTCLVLEKIWVRLGMYMRTKFIEMAIIGTIIYIVLLFTDMPFPIVLAIVVALGELIPLIGPWIARLPLFGIAALQGWTTFAIVVIASVILENLKGIVISPIVEGKGLNMHPLLVFVSVLIGSSLLGFAGAFIAVPAAATIQVVFEEVVIPWRRQRIAGQSSAEEPVAVASELGAGP
jgi:putative permease